ncbi:unnamed protein product [Haemonchus placei]|uniref:Doublecortin domain-containing protein n=1 Tax=Haemonchus placei TaxID=6290 RepID=A0A0N4W4T2_HAEPC|nr:unnamed protein product [Haemonchus placei]
MKTFSGYIAPEGVHTVQTGRLVIFENRPYSIFKALFLFYCSLFALAPTSDRLLRNLSTGIRRDYLEFSGS